MKTLFNIAIKEDSTSHVCSKAKETNKAICFTYDKNFRDKVCSCRMIGCHHKGKKYSKRYYVWIPKFVLKKGIEWGATSVKINSEGVKGVGTAWRIGVDRKYFKTSFEHYIKSENAKPYST
jgi:hypothetical protein